MPSWRLRAREVIRDVIAGLSADERRDLDLVRRRIYDAYPFGERRYLPYKTWLDEVAKATDDLATEPRDRICKTCGAKPRRPCRELETGLAMPGFHASRLW